MFTRHLLRNNIFPTHNTVSTSVTCVKECFLCLYTHYKQTFLFNVFCSMYCTISYCYNHGLISAGTGRYGVPRALHWIGGGTPQQQFLLRQRRYTMYFRGSKHLKNTKLLRIICVSQAQNAPKLFRPELYNAPLTIP